MQRNPNGFPVPLIRRRKRAWAVGLTYIAFIFAPDIRFFVLAYQVNSSKSISFESYLPYLEEFEKMSELRQSGRTTLIVTIVMTVLASFALGLRFYCNVKLKRSLNAADYLITAAFANYVVYVVMLLYGTQPLGLRLYHLSNELSTS